MINSIKEFKKEALKNIFFSEWHIISESDESITFQKIENGSKPSCLIALLLMILFLIPGILYLFLGGTPQRTRILTINCIDDRLMPNGDSQAVSYSKAIIENKLEVIAKNEKIKKIVIWSILIAVTIMITIALCISAVQTSRSL